MQEQVPVEQATKKGGGNATAGLVCGIVGLIMALLLPPIGFFTSLAGTICGGLGIRYTRGKVGLGLSIAGIIISILYGLWILATS